MRRAALGNVVVALCLVVPAYAADEVIDEIVVTARKRDELIQDTPVSVTAISAAALERSSVKRMDDIQQLAPNVTITSGQNGINGNLRVRGVGATATDIAFEPGVGVFVDGVFMPRSFGNLLDLVDVRQVEVLRGPQGTLFGKNTVGGAINVTTAKPGPDTSGSISVGGGNFGLFETRATLNVPVRYGWLEDRLFARAALRASNVDGFMENKARNEDASNRDSLAFLGSVRLLATDDVVLDLSGSWAREHSRSRGAQCVVVRNSLIGASVARECERIANDGYDFEADRAGLSDVESYGSWATATWDIPDVDLFPTLQLKSITAWRAQRARVRQDLDYTPLPFISLASVGDVPESGRPGRQKQISHELQLTGATHGGHFDFVTGAFTFFEDGTDTRTVTAIRDKTETATEIDNRTWALFGQASYHINEWLSLSGGLRYSVDRKEAQQRVTRLGSGGAEPLSDAASETFDGWTPMAGVRLTAPHTWLGDLPIDHLVGYATYARGFKGGGFNAVLNPQTSDPNALLEQFEPEELDSFEIGTKVLAYDGRLGANLSLFYGQWKDQQVQAFETTDVGAGTTPRVETRTLNAAESTIQGIELEVVAVPAPSVRIDASVGFLDSEYDEFTDAISAFDGEKLDRSGESFPDNPELQTRLALQYGHAIDGSWHERLRGEVTPRIEWYYQGEIFYEGPELDAGRQGGLHLVNGRIDYALFDDQVTLGLWGRNLTDRRYIDEVFSLGGSIGTANRFLAAPRTFGGEVRYRF